MQVTWLIPVSWTTLSLEKSIFRDDVVPTIAHDPAKCPGTKGIQTAALTDTDAPHLTAIQQDRENQGSEQLDLCFLFFF